MNTPLHFGTLTRRFGGRAVLDGIDLTLQPGQLVLLSGANGAGKSTLLKLLAGIERPDRGGLLDADGRPLRWSAAKQRLRSHVVYLHQQPYLFDRSVLANLTYGLTGSRTGREARARLALAEVGLDHLAERTVSDGLSGGERQRLALARALLREPAHLLLDEPTASLDPDARDLCLKLVSRLRERGIGLLVASHDLEAVAPLADQRWHLADGRLSERRPGPDRAPDGPLPFPTVISGGRP